MIDSAWTNFSEENRRFMDRQIQENMEIWRLEQNAKVAKTYLRRYAQWKTWDDDKIVEIQSLLKLSMFNVQKAVKDQNVWRAYHFFAEYSSKNGFFWLWPMCKYALEKKALTNKQKKFALDVMKRMGNGPREAFRRRKNKSVAIFMAEWLLKHLKELEQFCKLASFRDISVGNSDTINIDGITIHNSIGANERVLSMMKKQIQQATRLIKGGNYAPMKKVLYGHAHLVSDVGGHNTLGFYNSGEDNVYIRTFLRGSKGTTNDRTGYIHVLIHELAHRCFRKFIDNDFKINWRTYYTELDRKEGKFEWPPKKGDPAPFGVKGKGERGEIFFHSITDRGHVLMYSSRKGEENRFDMGTQSRILRIMSQYSKGNNFPSQYSRTNYEEFYCETVAYYLRNDLRAEFMDRVKSLFGISTEEPEPEIHKGGDEEKKEESEGVDLVDKIISWIEGKLKKREVRKVNGEFKQVTHIASVLDGLVRGWLSEEFSKMGRTAFAQMVEKAIVLGVERGKFEFDNNGDSTPKISFSIKGNPIIFINVDLKEDKNDSEVEQLVAERFGSLMQLLFDMAENTTPEERTLLQLVSAVGDTLSKEGITVDVSVISDIIKERLDTLVGISGLSTGGKGARITLNGNKYVFSNITVDPTESVDFGLFIDYMENVILENLNAGDSRTYNLDDLVEFVDASSRWGGSQPSKNRDRKLETINRYFNGANFSSRFNLTISGDKYIITKKDRTPKENPDTGPKEKIEFKEMNELQTAVMKEVCALLKGGSGDLTASDVFNSMGDKAGDISLRGFGRSMGKLVRLCYLETNGKCPKGTIYKLGKVGIAWCKINAPSTPAKKPAKPKKPKKENSVENALLKELRDLYQLVEPKGDKKSTGVVVSVGRELKKSDGDKLNSDQVKKLKDVIAKLKIDISSLPLLKAQLNASADGADDENVTPLVIELRKLYVDVRKAGVSKRSLTILTRIAQKVKSEGLDEVSGDDLLALQRLIARAELSTADYPIIFKVVDQSSGGTDSDDTDDSGGEEFPTVTEVMKIILRVMGKNIDKEESASSIREKVNKFPNTNVTTKGLGRSMGALVRYGYLEKTGTSPSGTTYKGNNLLKRWVSANTPKGEITDLGKDILRVFGKEPRLLWNSKKMHTTLIANGMADVSAIGVGRSMGKLAKDGWLTKFEDKKVFKINEKGLNWYYNDLAK